MNGQIDRNGDGLSHFLAELRSDGCDGRHVERMLERIRAERAAVEAVAARVFFSGSRERPLSMLELADELRELRHRAMSLELAIVGACNEAKIDDCGEALAYQAGELSRGMERFEKAFTAELHMIRKDDDHE